MKCRLCGHEIKEQDKVCPGCDNEIDYLIDQGYIIGAKKKNKTPKDFVVDDSVLKENEVYKEEEPAKEFVPMESNMEVSKEDISFDDVHTVLAGREPLVIEDVYEEEPKEEEVIEPEVIEKKPKKILLATIFMTLFFIVIASTYFFLLYFSSPKIVGKTFEKVLSSMENKISGNMSIETNITFNSSENTSLNDININLDVKADEAKSASADIYIYNGPELLSVSDMFKNDNELFIYNRDLYHKYLEVSKAEMVETKYYKFINFILNSRDFSNTSDGLRKLLNNRKIKSNYTKERKTISINGKDKGVTETTLLLNDNFINVLNGNEKLLESISSLFDLTPEEFILNLKSSNYKVMTYTNSYVTKFYKVEITGNDFNMVITLDDNKVSNIDIKTNEDTINISNNMSRILILNDDIQIRYNNKISSTDINLNRLYDEYVPYRDIKAVIDSNLSNSNIRNIYDSLFKKTLND